MTTGDRMKLRRKEAGIPVERIATALGVSIATVYRYENGDIEKVPGSVLEPLAKVLGTTPQWLMGWSEKQNPDPITHLAITDAREELMIKRYRQLDDQDKADIYRYSGYLLEQEKYKQKKSLTLEPSSMGEKGRAVARGGVILEQEHPIDEDAFLRAIAESEPPEKV